MFDEIASPLLPVCSQMRLVFCFRHQPSGKRIHLLISEMNYLFTLLVLFRDSTSYDLRALTCTIAQLNKLTYKSKYKDEFSFCQVFLAGF